MFAFIIGFFMARGQLFVVENQALDLLLYKVLLVSGGFLHAHIVRKLAFPYVNFKTSKNKMHQAMIVGLYLTIIWAYARGG
jgi:hypothetical protein